MSLRPGVVALLASREVSGSLRGRWFLIGAGAFAALSIAVAQLGLAGAERWGISALDRTAAALLNLVLLFVPLLTLPLGVSSFAGEAEDGTLPYIVAQPVTRGEVYFGKLLGLLAAMSLSLLIGFGASAVWLGLQGGASPAAFLALAGGAWCLGVVTTSLGVALAVLSGSRARALAASVGCWLVLVFLCDFGILAIAATQMLGADALFGIAVANPLQSAKTLAALAISQRLEILGPVGIEAVRALGRGGLAAALGMSLALWTVLSASAGVLAFRRGNLA